METVGMDKGLVDAMSSFGLKGPLKGSPTKSPPPPPTKFPSTKSPRHLPFLNLVPREISLIMNNARRNRDMGVRFSPIERSTSAAHPQFLY